MAIPLPLLDDACPNGGMRFELGGEVVGVACNGAKGDQGDPGIKGDPGIPGDPGPAGASVVPTVLAVGDANCPNGGTQFTVGTTTTYACNGADGAAGATGPTGPAGASGVVTSVSIAGSGGTIAAASADWEFYGPTATVTTTSTQKILAMVSASLGVSTAGAIGEAWVDACYRSSTGTTVSSLSGGAGQYVDVENRYTSVAVHALGTPGAGTWDVGFCVQNLHATQVIDNNDYATGVFIVTN